MLSPFLVGDETTHLFSPSKQPFSGPPNLEPNTTPDYPIHEMPSLTFKFKPLRYGISLRRAKNSKSSSAQSLRNFAHSGVVGNTALKNERKQAKIDSSFEVCKKMIFSQNLEFFGKQRAPRCSIIVSHQPYFQFSKKKWCILLIGLTWSDLGLNGSLYEEKNRKN